MSFTFSNLLKTVLSISNELPNVDKVSESSLNLLTVPSVIFELSILSIDCIESLKSLSVPLFNVKASWKLFFNLVKSLFSKSSRPRTFPIFKSTTTGGIVSLLICEVKSLLASIISRSKETLIPNTSAIKTSPPFKNMI